MYAMLSDMEKHQLYRLEDRILKMDETTLDAALELIAAEDREKLIKLINSVKITNTHRLNLI